MAITDPRVIAFVTNRLRVRAEQIRALLHLMEDDRDKWTNEINALVPDESGNILEDGREAEGISRLSGEDINLIVTRIGQLLSILENDGAIDPVLKACVRPLRIESEVI